MNKNIEHKLKMMKERLAKLTSLLSEEDATKDMNAFKKISKEHSEISSIVSIYNEYISYKEDLDALEDLCSDTHEMKDLIHQEERELKAKLEDAYTRICNELAPEDKDTNKDIYLEIRAGTGGAESAIFAADLFKMYAYYATNHKLNIEIYSSSISELGGYKELISKVSGKGAYARFKFESGIHRVQRIPVTETQGRVHTSAASVAVLPEVDIVDQVEINQSDLRIDTYRASGAGGQHVNKTDSAIRITHIPTNIVVCCQEDRSQHKNKAKALSILAAKIRDAQNQEAIQKHASQRKSQIGSGDRSERIRTYNFPQGRITDHRINLTLYKIEDIMRGNLDELVNQLDIADRANKLSEITEA